MTAPRLTRRSLLIAAAGSGALTVAPPMWIGATAEGAPAAAAPRVLALPVGDLAAGTHLVLAPLDFDLVGVQWRAPRHPGLWLRTVAAGGAPDGGWANAAATGHGPDRVAPIAARFGDPVWTGPARRLQLRADRPVRDVVVHLVTAPSTPAEATAAATLPLAGPPLPAGPGQPPIIARDAWAQGMAPPPRGGAVYGAVRLAFVHHTENPNGYASADVPAMLRAIWAYHVQVRGWRDIGYNFVIDGFGRTFEARAGGIDEPVVGAQAGGWNLVSTGVAVLGDFSVAPASAAALAALENLLAWKLSLHGVPTTGRVSVRLAADGAAYSQFAPGSLVALPRIAGHRDGDATDCPGNALYAQLPVVRQAAEALAGQPLVVTLAAAALTFAAPGPAVLSGALTSLDGTPVPGASVALQSRALDGSPAAPLETTVAAATTDAQGRFAASLPLSFNAALRALFPGGPGLPASVSEPLSLSVTPVLALAASSTAPAVGAPVILSGTVSPALQRVLVTVSTPALSGGRAHQSVHHLATSNGAFSVTFNPARPGAYRCVASVPAGVYSAPGASPPVTVNVA